MSLATATPEQRLEWLAKAKEARRSKLKGTIRSEYADMDEWERLAKEVRIRLPHSGFSVTTRAMRQ